MLKNNQKIPLDKFIQKTLYDKNKGYYIKKNPIGYKGDFITSPYLSIMFSEMIAIWLVSFWKKLGSPQNINIVELGAGNGEMIYQIIKAINNFKKFKLSSKFFIHEKSKYLKKIQKNKNIINNIIWVENLKKLSRSPTIFIANEFFDAFPFKQFIKKKNIWFEKYITSKDSKLRMIDVKKKFSYLDKIINEKLSSNIKFIEYSPVALKKLGIISKIIKKNNGGILIIDYGYNSKKMFDTLQSVKNHKKNNFLENVYSSDITHMLNFRHYKKKLNDMKIDSIKLTTQRKFLIKLGILQRAEILSKNLPFSKKTDIYLRLKRLIDEREMGKLFKVLFATKKKNRFNLGF